VGDAFESLPIGSHLDSVTGVFTWQPGLAFLNAYDFVFLDRGDGHATSRRDVRIVISARGSNRVGPQVVIDLPAPQAQLNVGQPFLVAGWAIDGDAPFGTDVDTVHVWAYPRSRCLVAACDAQPIFLGVAGYAGRRDDIAALFGDRFRESGYGLIVDTLPPGTYDIAVFAWSAATGGFVPARVVTIVIR